RPTPPVTLALSRCPSSPCTVVRLLPLQLLSALDSVLPPLQLLSVSDSVLPVSVSVSPLPGQYRRLLPDPLPCLHLLRLVVPCRPRFLTSMQSPIPSDRLAPTQLQLPLPLAPGHPANRCLL